MRGRGASSECWCRVCRGYERKDQRDPSRCSVCGTSFNAPITRAEEAPR